MIAKGGSTHLEFALIKRIAIVIPPLFVKIDIFFKNPLVILNNMHYNITFSILSRKIKGKWVLGVCNYTKFTPQNIALHL